VLTLRQNSLRWLVAFVPALLLMGCGSGSTTRPILAEHCLSVGGPRPSTLTVVAPEQGTLRIRIQERGVTVIATLDADARSAAESPVERLGTIHLVTETKAGQPHLVRVTAEDSPDISGEYCLSADLIADGPRLTGERAFASAGRATHNHEWEAAFEQYLDASRAFDRLHARRGSSESRQAMAEIAYLRFDNKRDTYALASEALADLGNDAEPYVRGGLIALQSKALVDMPGMEATAIAPQVRQLQAAARKHFQANPAGSRELPRLDIMTGFFVYRFSEFDKARELFSNAAQSCREARDWDCYAIASQNVALLEYEGKNYTDALKAFSNALRSLPPGLDPKLAADIWNNYGSLQGLMGFFSGSERSHAAAMREYAQLGDCQGVRRNLARSGNLMVQLGTLGDAKNYLQQAASFDCAALLANAAASAPADTAIARQDAYPRGQRNPEWCAKSLDPGGLAYENKLIVFNSLVSLGDALMLEGDSKSARRCFDAAEPFAPTAQTRMRLADARGEMLLETRDAAGARTAFQQALRIADEANVPSAYEYRGRAQLGMVKAALLAGDAQAAVRDGLPALEASIGRADIDHTVASLRLLAGGYRGLNQRAQAVRTLQTAADLIEAVPINELDGEKRATYLATQYAVFAELTDLYASDAATNPSMASLAFMTSERGRARSLRYAVTQAERDVASEAPPAARYQQLLQDVVKLGDSHGSSRQTTLIDDLDAAALRERKAEELLDQQQLALTLGQLHANFVEYAIGTRDMFAFVVNESGLHAIRLGDNQKISGAAAELHDRLLDSESPQGEVRAAARRLAELVLWPITTQLTGKRLIFVADGGLHTVPFNVLPWSGEDSATLVLQHAEVSIAPSALFLTRIRTNKTAHTSAPRFALLGDPVFRISDWRRECTDAFGGQTNARISRAVSDWTESLPRLPGSRAEVQMVARLGQQSRPASRIEILLGCQAVPTALRRAANEHVDLLHIATHALVDSQRPRLSALALTPEHRGDTTASAFGLLDILGLKLSSGLVVLSACETSRGRLLPGEGVLGPAQAFLQAGARAVVASYWRVDDVTTSKFMQQFYKYLLAERLPAATALRRAQMEAAETASSHDWAAFSLYGWPDSSI
jgi:CHAT domain-containing protein/tetratricopeptide (TPR) repeat protein